MSGEFTFWFPGDAEVHDGWAKTYFDAAHISRQFDADRQPHAIELDVVEQPASGSESLPELCVNVLDALRHVDDTTETERYTMRWLTQVHATMRRVRESSGMHVRVHPTLELAVQPAGMLLVDLQHDMSAGSTGQGSTEGSSSAIWMSSIRDTLEQNPLARAGAEYAIAIDLPMEPGLVGRETLIRSTFRVMGEIATMLPQRQHQMSTLAELWLNLSTTPGTAAPHGRLRLWRLGYMKIRDERRIV